MKLPVSHFAWQVLRAGKKPQSGLALRVTPTRYSKDGTFLTELVGRGLL